jgi:hypothetical protein
LRIEYNFRERISPVAKAASDVNITITVIGAMVICHVRAFIAAKKTLNINTPQAITDGERIILSNKQKQVTPNAVTNSNKT